MSKGEQTRAAIVDHAVDHASEVGLEGLSIGSLAIRLKLSKSGLFAHFGSKQELQLATLRRAQERFEDQVFRPSVAAPRGLPRLRLLFRNWLEWLGQQPGGCVILSASTEFDDRPGAVRDALVAGQRQLRGAIAKAIRLAIEAGELRPDVDPWQLAFELFGAMLAAHHDWHLLEDKRAFDRALQAIDSLLAANARSPREPSRTHKETRP